MSDEPILRQAQDKLKPFEPDLLKAFAKVFQRKKPPQTMRALAPLAMVLLLEAFGLAYLLDRLTVRLAVMAARGPGKGDDDDLLDDSDEMIAIRWAAARHDALDRAYNTMAREIYKNSSTGLSFIQWIDAGYGPDRATFEQQWGQRNPIDSATAPKCFDPSAQLSILDTVGQGDGYLGAFVSTHFLTSSAQKQITCMGQMLDLAECTTIEAVAAKAVRSGWIAYLDHRGAVTGARLIPRTDGVRIRLRAPIVNIGSIFHDDKHEKQIEVLKLARDEAERKAIEIDRQWQDATGASDPEVAREMTAQRVSQIADQDMKLKTLADLYSPPISQPESRDPEDVKNAPTEQGVGRMIWPDPDNAPTPIECANAIVAHRRNEFVELEFPPTPKIFENIRAWLMFHSFGLRAPTPDATGYCTCAIGEGGEIPPDWTTMKQAKRNSYPGFVLFGPENTGKVVFCVKEVTQKTAKRSTKKVVS